MSTAAIELSNKENKMTVTQEQMTLARQTVAKDLDEKEFGLYCYNCQRLGVHPLDGMVIPIKRKDSEAGEKRLTFVTTVDLLRSRAADSGEYAGSDDPTFEYELKKDPDLPSDAHCTVWRFVQGQKCSFSATARWEEYYPGEKQGFMWRSKPHVMLGKCAEALALRKGFPKQLAGLYIPEELQQDAPPRATKQSATPPVGNVKCSECKATGGHLPNCSKRPQSQAQAPAKPEPVMCGDCGRIDGHDAACKHAQKQTAQDNGKQLQKAVVLILAVEKLLKKADKEGKREPYIKLRVVNQANEEFDMFVWHKTPQEFLNEKLIDKNMLCDFSVGKRTDGTPYHSLENIYEISGTPFIDNKPATQKAEEGW